MNAVGCLKAQRTLIKKKKKKLLFILLKCQSLVCVIWSNGWWSQQSWIKQLLCSEVNCYRGVKPWVFRKLTKKFNTLVSLEATSLLNEKSQYGLVRLHSWTSECVSRCVLCRRSRLIHKVIRRLHFCCRRNDCAHILRCYIFELLPLIFIAVMGAFLYFFKFYLVCLSNKKGWF